MLNFLFHIKQAIQGTDKGILLSCKMQFTGSLQKLTISFKFKGLNMHTKCSSNCKCGNYSRLFLDTVTSGKRPKCSTSQNIPHDPSSLTSSFTLCRLGSGGEKREFNPGGTGQKKGKERKKEVCWCLLKKMVPVIRPDQGVCVYCNDSCPRSHLTEQL